MSPEQKLDQLLGRAAPPVRDIGFLTEVAQRVALRRAWLGAAAMLPWLVISCVLMWAIAPSMLELWPDLSAVIAMPVGALAGSAWLAISAVWLTRRLSRTH
ncbi:hypothetical protein [Brevundimonas variabilis]|uniref:Uncharacterized protein n=1 Tax=Brevundimonas variabilis TaxID=74312 RepID=A0A7W9CI00_9CAUL|nr:hypothetical protein [Brevundimonas variabilis]MBB5745987.1 hypothetical protein [Brevundimonas variabilis]